MNVPCIVAAAVAALGAGVGVPAEAYAQPADGPQGADDIVARATEIVRGAETAYVSDYISFAGADASGPDFQGLYLAAGDGDLYVHDAPASAAASTGNPLMAFRVRGGERVPVDAPEFEVARFDRGFGFYRWPAEWRVRWRGDCGAAVLSVRSIDHETQTNWLTGGFAMRAVEGRISCGAETVPVFGFAELIR